MSPEKTEGYNSKGRDYIPLDFRWRWGLGIMLPHSTQRTLPALCSSSVTLSEIRRPCAQAPVLAIGGGFVACSGSLSFTLHLSDTSRYW